MPDEAPNLANLRNKLRIFVSWRRANLRGDEKGEAQVFLDRLFQALGHEGIYEAGATLEYRLANDNGGTSFADLMWKPRALIEMKKAGTDLSRHYRQAFDYWVHAVPERPRYVVLCNFDQFWIYDFENQLDEPVERFRLDELEHRSEAIGFLFPSAVTPVFNNDLVAVTREAAADVAKVFVSLRDRGVAAPVAQRFALQCVMAMFAEDIALLPGHYFTRAVADAKNGQDAYDLIGGLFREMNTPGFTAGGRYTGTPYFNGGLFAEVVPQELTVTEIELLRAASSTIWSDVRPEIFGTLFEGSMDAGERHASGAHFTSQADIVRIIGPTIVQPWRQRIDAASSIQDLSAILEAMSQFRVLDPSCGSGNFLYVAYRELRRLERDAIEKIRERRRSQAIAGQESFGYVSPEQFFGIDVNPFAVEVAKVTMLLGKKLADDEMLEVGATLPLNNLDKNIVAGDALFDRWPPADVIVGNPPYLGRRKMVRELGAGYVARLDATFGPKGVADFVTYWFPKAHDALPIGGRAGFVATKSIKQVDGRRASLDYIVENGGVIFDAVAAMKWSGDAQVTVAIVSWQKGGTPPAKKTLWVDVNEPALILDEITAALSPEINLKKVQKLATNRKGVYQGQTLGVTSAFKIDSFKARKFLRESPVADPSVFPLLGGDAMLHAKVGTEWIIDISTRNADDAWREHPEALKHLESAALPERVKRAREESEANELALAVNPKAKLNKHHSEFLTHWWNLWRRRGNYVEAMNGVDRYIALSRVSSESREPIFSFIDGAFHIEDSMVSFPYSDDYSFGILQSQPHITWFRERCSTLETRLRYTLTTVFNSFPWPQNPSPSAVTAVTEAAVAINEYRGRAFVLGSTLADQYDVLRRPGQSQLRDLHAALDAAVLQAYGFDADEDLLTQIFELNLLVATKEAEGDEVTAPGPHPTTVKPSTWRWPAPSL
ncbi:DNA methyltransferase [Cryobacterium melibiosiphilum]|nr:DNA methyltransferase [Cryobacterium melibiosiphilum]